MPANADGSLRQFTGAEIDAMEFETFGVRDFSNPVETRKLDENTMTRPWFVKWEKRYEAVEALLGNSVLWTDNTDPMNPVVKLSRQLPHSGIGRHPDYPNLMATRVESIRGHGQGTDDGNKFPQYQKAVLTVFYEQFKGTIKSDASTSVERERFCTRGPTSSELEIFGPLPGGAFKYTTATSAAPHGKPIPYNVSFPRPIRRFTITWHMLPNELYVGGGALFERLFVGEGGDGVPYMGCVNSEPIEFIGLGTYPAGTLLLEGVEDREHASPLAESGVAGIRHDVSFKFAFAARGWLDLYFPNAAAPSETAFYRVSNDGVYYAVNAMPDFKGLYCVRDFNNLFDPNPP